MTESSGMRIVLAGAAPDTGNLGVSALCFGALRGVFEHDPSSLVHVLDFGRGVRGWPSEWQAGLGACRRLGVRRTRRVYRPEATRRIELSLAVGGLGNPAARVLLNCDALLDISGGDSFTDLYGEWRLASVVWPKRMAIRLGKPLILLPQTYGPFRGGKARAMASEIVRRSAMCWARDARSFEILKDLLGGDFESGRHRCGVDVAFLLGLREPSVPLGETLKAWLSEADARTIGFNVSGLIHLSEDGGRAQYGLRADYRAAVEGFVSRVLDRTDARVMLMPHVIAPKGHYESDNDACERLRAGLGRAGEGRVVTAPILTDPREAKWLISKMSWFCGTRMHSTIAGLSSGVPTAAIAYSDKTRGVFDTCGQGEHVADPRSLDTEGLVEALWASFEARAQVRESLLAALPGVLAQAEGQMREVCEAVRRGAEGCAA